MNSFIDNCCKCNLKQSRDLQISKFSQPTQPRWAGFEKRLGKGGKERRKGRISKLNLWEKTARGLNAWLQPWVTEEYVQALNKLNAPCKVILTLRKLKTVMPSLNVAVDKSFKSRVVYKLLCPRCQACYVGQTDQHLVKRFKQHCQPSQPFGKHIRQCRVSPVFDDKKDVSVLHVTTRSIPFLEALEAFWIREICPSINTKDEYRRREFTIKL